MIPSRCKFETNKAKKQRICIANPYNYVKVNDFKNSNSSVMALTHSTSSQLDEKLCDYF